MSDTINENASFFITLNPMTDSKKNIQLEASWLEALSEEFAKDYFKKIKEFLKAQKAQGKNIFPPGPLIFNALNSCPLDKVKVVILGQDPYHGPGQAHGLSFSVPEGIALPPSLQNIYKEIDDSNACPGKTIPKSGDLSHWAQQGVLLLNASLTVEAHQANSHANIGWHEFTDAAIKAVSQETQDVVFMLWGSFARKKKTLIEPKKHCILEAPHPSPLSAYRGFMGCGHFLKCNEYLKSKQKDVVSWFK